MFFNGKVTKSDVENLKDSLENLKDSLCTNCPLVGLLADNDYILSKSKLETTAVRDSILSKLTGTTKYKHVPDEESMQFVQKKLSVNHAAVAKLRKAQGLRAKACNGTKRENVG